MLILALDASSRTASVALYREGVPLGQSYQNNGLTHSQTLMPMVESLLKNTRIPAGDIGLVAVTHGPGSFTGLRIGVSTAAGLAWGWGLPCIGVSSLEAAAMGVRHMGGLICAVMDARRGQVYNALFMADKDQQAEGGGLTRLTPDRAVSLDELREDVANKCPVLVGDGAEMCYNQWTVGDDAGRESTPAFAHPSRGECGAPLSPYGVRLAPPHLRYPNAWAVAVLSERAALRGETVPPERLWPVYLRPSQAERERGSSNRQ